MAELVPDPDLTRLDAKHPSERRGGERGDLGGVAHAAQVDEQPGERGKIEDARGAERLGSRRQRRRQRPQELEHPSGKRALGIDVEDADGHPAGAEWNGNLDTTEGSASR